MQSSVLWLAKKYHKGEKKHACETINLGKRKHYKVETQQSKSRSATKSLHGQVSLECLLALSSQCLLFKGLVNNIRLSGWKETFSCDALGLNREEESDRNEARGREKKAFFFFKWSNYTLPALSATQAESTPKIKYTLHLGTKKTHSVEVRSTGSKHTCMQSPTVHNDDFAFVL